MAKSSMYMQIFIFYSEHSRIFYIFVEYNSIPKWNKLYNYAEGSDMY